MLYRSGSKHVQKLAYLGKPWNNLAEEEVFSPHQAFLSIIAELNVFSTNHKVQVYSCDPYFRNLCD